MTEVTPISAFTDNYIWCLHDDRYAIVVDPGDAAPVFRFLEQRQLQLVAILITHHHPDHIGGVNTLLKQHPDLVVFGPHSTRIPGINQPRAEGEEVVLPHLGDRLQVMEVPGHTQEQISYYGNLGLFCGDTLFSAGCARLFEGTAEEMHGNFLRFGELPGDTKVYCTHEYTLANLNFALLVDPEHAPTQAYFQQAQATRAQDQATLPSRIDLELTINPFMRVQDQAVIQAAETYSGTSLTTDVAVFSALRRWKDSC